MKLWIAQGFGVGRIPVAPGTWGSVVGLGWLALLLPLRSWPLFIGANAAAIGLSIWLCGAAERTLNRKDPGCVVLDEIVAIPLCFTAWLAAICHREHRWPEAGYLCAHWLSTIGIFALFRLFDVAKPWPVRQSQSLPGGLGVTVDDVLAAVYVNLVMLAAITLGWKP
jgi:phosphatidylglycerophosphatase A